MTIIVIVILMYHRHKPIDSVHCVQFSSLETALARKSNRVGFLSFPIHLKAEMESNL
jgi:hypothetical protein